MAPSPVKISHKKMATKGGCIDYPAPGCTVFTIPSVIQISSISAINSVLLRFNLGKPRMAVLWIIKSDVPCELIGNKSILGCPIDIHYWQSP